jgi:hypothetical protein
VQFLSRHALEPFDNIFELDWPARVLKSICLRDDGGLHAFLSSWSTLLRKNLQKTNVPE